MTPPICPKCKANDTRVFPYVEGWVWCVCPRCAHKWKYELPDKDKN